MNGLYQRAWGEPPRAHERAPARINLLGEHTDYNDGFVLPTPLPFATEVSVGPGMTPGVIEGWSQRFGAAPARPLDAPRRGDWLDYVIGCVRALADIHPIPLREMRVAIESDVPVGAGLSSSAALEVATLRALRCWFNINLSDAELARLAQQAEHRYVGVPCGIMDQTVSALGQPGHALFLDTRNLEREQVPLPLDFRIAVVHSGVTHRLSESGYGRRRQECREAAQALGVPSLRALDETGGLTCEQVEACRSLPPPLDRRVRHVLSENARVLRGVEALRRADILAFARLMNDSHRSQRVDFDVSLPEVDAVVEAALRHGAVGARLTGGGFGGSVVTLLAEQSIERWWPALHRECPAAWLVFPAVHADTMRP